MRLDSVCMYGETEMHVKGQPAPELWPVLRFLRTTLRASSMSATSSCLWETLFARVDAVL